ncbi:MAG: hypothetical protein HC930_02460 [Hydrococcus sp. SU_1_0]|nr:hypothetical protein [Hydrococcus sp. SU_1_0]
MTEPKYPLGKRISYSPFIVRGFLILSNGETRYYLQVGNSDNTIVATEVEIDRAIEIVDNQTIRLMRSRVDGDRNSKN